jgi:agmatinase
MNKNARRFGDFDATFAEYGSAAVCLLPLPFEATSSYLEGTRAGPQALIAASQAVEHYDEELDFEPFRVGIHTCAAPEMPPLGEKALPVIQKNAEGLLEDGKFVVGLGGEHTVTIGLVRAVAQQYSPLTVIQLDAHADLRDSYAGSPYNHACTMRRIREFCQTIHMGMRAMDRAEIDYIRRHDVPLYPAFEMRRKKGWLEEALRSVEGPVYLTIDLDVVDPALLPAVGTPEPGGLGWYELLHIAREIFRRSEVVGMDLVELCPRPGHEVSSFVAAKLLYKLIGYRYAPAPLASGHTV